MFGLKTGPWGIGRIIMLAGRCVNRALGRTSFARIERDDIDGPVNAPRLTLVGESAVYIPSHAEIGVPKQIVRVMEALPTDARRGSLHLIYDYVTEGEVTVFVGLETAPVAGLSTIELPEALAFRACIVADRYAHAFAATDTIVDHALDQSHSTTGRVRHKLLGEGSSDGSVEVEIVVEAVAGELTEPLAGTAG